MFAVVSFLIKLLFTKVETPAQVFCAFCEIFKNTFFHRKPPGDCFFPYQEINLREFISLVVVKFDVNVKRFK